MTLGKILDYSQARPPLGKVKANGYSGVYRYVCSDKSETGLPGKRLTPAERDAILAAGLDLGLHGEDEATAAQLGYAKGRIQGQQWAVYAHDVLAAPKGMTIVAAVDFDTAGTYPNVVSDYLHGVHDGLAGEYQVGVYGSIYVVDAALAEKSAVHGVQTVAWSHNKVSSWAHLYQHGSGEFPGTDYNDVLRIPHGTWLQTLRGDMALTQDDYTGIAKALVDELFARGMTQSVGNNATADFETRFANLSARIANVPGLDAIHNDLQAILAKLPTVATPPPANPFSTA